MKTLEHPVVWYYFAGALKPGWMQPLPKLYLYSIPPPPSTIKPQRGYVVEVRVQHKKKNRTGIQSDRLLSLDQFRADIGRRTFVPCRTVRLRSRETGQRRPGWRRTGTP